MVFSFFKKKPKEPAAPAPARPRDGAAAEDPQEAARRLARQTAAKIDAIEKEMTRMGQTQPRSTIAPATGIRGEPTQGPASQSRDQAAVPTQAAPAEFDPGDDVLARTTVAIEVNTTSASSMIDEAAILFANGQADAAEAVLKRGIEAGEMGRAERRALQMLLELVNQRGERLEFEDLSARYRDRLGAVPPDWVEYATAGASVRQSAGGDATGLRLPEAVDRGVAALVADLTARAQAGAGVTLDVGAVQTVDAEGAALLLRLIAAFERAQAQLMLAGAERWLDALQASAAASPHAPGDPVWMLWLQALRILGRMEAFEEAAIQYCIAREVSPPSWETPSPNVRPLDRSDRAGGESADRIEWSGVIEGEGERPFGRLLASSASSPRLVVECMQLRRMAFSSASALLGLSRRLGAAGKTVELRNVNPMVVALLQLLGVTDAMKVDARGS